MGQINYTKVTHVNLQNLEQPEKTYAQAQSRMTLDIEQLAAHMAKHNTPFTKGTIKGILTDAVECIRELILDGNIVNLGELGTLNVVLQSNGVCESVVDEITGEKPVFTAADITAVNLRFTPGIAFKNMISEVTFNEVESTKKQAEHLKVKKQALAAGTWDPKDGSTGGSSGNGGSGTQTPGGGTSTPDSGDQSAD